MKRIFFVCLLTAGISSFLFGQTKRQDIIKFLEVSKANQQAEQMFDLMMPGLMQIEPAIPMTFWSMFKSRLDTNSFVEMLIPIYDKHFSHDDIKELIQFYESPIGKKLLNVSPSITQDSYRVGEEWGQKISLDIMSELIKQGFF